MKNKFLLGIGSLASIALPVTAVVACNNDVDSETDTVNKTAKVTVGSPANVLATVTGSANAYALAYDASAAKDTAVRADLETELVAMVAKADGDSATRTFTGKWTVNFDRTKDAAYVLTVSAAGYDDVVFTVTVTGNVVAPVNKTAKVTVGSPANVLATVTGSANAYALAYDASATKDTAVRADLETELVAMVAKADGDSATRTFTGKWTVNFDRTKNTTYVLTVSAAGYDDVVFTVTVTGYVAAPVNKTAKVTVGSPANVLATVTGSANAYALAYDASATKDTALKADLETALVAMVAEADGDSTSPTFKGTWTVDFDRTKNTTYVLTVSAAGYDDVVFTVTVTGYVAAPVNKTAKVTVGSPANVLATVTGSANAYALAYDASATKDTAVRADLETALVAMVAKADGDSTSPTFKGKWTVNFDRTQDAAYVLTVSAAGYDDVVFTVTVTGNV